MMKKFKKQFFCKTVELTLWVFVSGMLVFPLLTACESPGSATQSTPVGAVSAQTTQATAASTTPAQPVNPFYTGDGGKGVSIAILPLKDTGLTAEQEYLPALVQGEFVSNFKGYSAISVLDRAQLDNQYAELLSGYYADDAEAGLDLGHLTPTDYILGGSVTKTATGYAMQIQITKSADKMTEASYSGTCTFMELDNLTGVRRATLDLLQKMGIQPTERTRTELTGAARAQVVEAQTADAKGYTADKGGRTAEAAIYYTQAAAIDPSMLQTASRASTLTASIASGSVGAGTRDLIQQRKDWIDLLTETEETIYKLINSASEKPPYALFYSNAIQWGDINYQTESRDASFETNLRGLAYWFDSVRVATQSVYGAVYNGLDRTGHKNEWGLGNWPGSGVTRQNPFATYWYHDINVVFELINEQGRAIGSQAYSRRAQYEPRRNGNQISISYKADDFITLRFSRVKAADISDRGMSIRVASVNGKPSEQTPFQITAIPRWENNTPPLLVENDIVKGFRSGVDTSRYRDLVIPATYWAEPITAIGVEAFKENRLTSVSIGHGITTIGNSAFANNQLTRLVIPDSVTTMGNSAFANNQLTSVAISHGITTIGDSAFSENKLTRLVIPDSVTIIRSRAFANSGLTGVAIGKGVTTIGDSAFANNSLGSVVIPDSVTTIGDNAFAKSGLYSVVIGKSVTAIGNNAFANNNRLTHVDIPDSVTTIGNSAFANNRLTHVVIGKGVKSIADNAFIGNNFGWYYNTRYRGTPHSISIPSNVTFVTVSTREGEDLWFGFIAAYDRNGKKAGKYTLRQVGIITGGIWSYSPE
ncbi:MAG: leucine-rich repeat protein [Treponema sp.]|jgi:TolB-like protein|nr:leucine-rich repeat protein [Treponema sp.]